MLQIVIEVIILMATCISGLYAFRYMNRFFRIIHIQVMVWIFFYAASHLLTIYQEMNGLQKNNQWLMNLHMFFETFLLMGAAWGSSRNNWIRAASVTGTFVFIIVFFIQLSTQGIAIYFNYADVTECIIVTVLYSLLLYVFSRSWTGPWWKCPEIVLCIGLLIYYACSVPYIAMMHYLQEKNPALNHLLFDLISNVLACVRYALTGIAFWMVRRNSILLKGMS